MSRIARPIVARVWLAFLALGVLAGACGGGGTEDSADDRPHLVVTTSILGDLVSTLVGDDATVEVLIPPGVDPHDFEASARQAADLRRADVVVANGLGLEVSLASTLASARDDGVTVVELGRFVDPIPLVEHDHDDHDDHGGDDPHFWHDPVRTAEAIPAFVAALVAAVPELDTRELAARAESVVADLEAVDTEIADILAAVPAERRYLVTNHDTLGYFAERYGFGVVGVVIAGGDTQSRPSAGELADLVSEISRHELPAIFAEAVADSGLVEQLAAELGDRIAVVSLYTDSLGEPGSGADSYLGMLRTNARLVAGALGG
jgi:zinc/manganese transport system substrate-binding protein